MKNNDKLEYIEDKFDTMYRIGSEWVFVPPAGLGFKIVGVMANGDLRLEKYFTVSQECKKKIIKSTPIGILRKACEILEIYKNEQAEKAKYIAEIKAIAREKSVK